MLYQYDVEGRFEYNIRSGNVVKRDHNKRRFFDVPAEDILHILSTSKPEIPLCYNDITADQIICSTVANDLDQANLKT